MKYEVGSAHSFLVLEKFPNAFAAFFSQVLSEVAFFLLLSSFGFTRFFAEKSIYQLVKYEVGSRLFRFRFEKKFPDAFAFFSQIFSEVVLLLFLASSFHEIFNKKNVL